MLRLGLLAMLAALLPAVAPGATPTTTLVAATPNPSRFGAQVTLTATISPAAATGKVTFYDSARVLGSATLSGGQAVLPTIALPAGSRSLKAYYLGDGTYASSTSTSLPHQVNAVASSLSRELYSPGAFSLTFEQSDFGGPTTGPNPVSLVAADFNGDGKADLATVNKIAFLPIAPTGSVSILQGNGDGTFKANVDYLVSVNPVSLDVGDFNLDGAVDLVVANMGSNTVSVLLGNGDGTFQAKSDYAVGNAPTSVADFNGDGIPDLVTANSADGTVSILLGNGNGTFQAKIDYATAILPYYVAVGDFNGDGFADLAVAARSIAPNPGTLSILLGNGSGAFPTRTDYTIPPLVMGMVIADFNLNS
jgi:hypothetical protein